MTDYGQAIGGNGSSYTSTTGTLETAPVGSPVAPSARTMQKGGRDALIALIGFCVTYTAAHYADMGITPEMAGLVPVLANFAYRWLRGASGNEPV